MVQQQKEYKLSPETRRKMSEARGSERCRQAYDFMSILRRGKAPPESSFARSMASRKLRRMGIDPKEAPALMEFYSAQYQQQIEENRRARESVS